MSEDFKEIKDELEIRLDVFKKGFDVIRLSYLRALRISSQLEYIFGDEIDIQKMDFKDLKRLSHLLNKKGDKIMDAIYCFSIDEFDIYEDVLNAQYIVAKNELLMDVFESEDEAQDYIWRLLGE